mgnify:CR=1 FL=1
MVFYGAFGRDGTIYVKNVRIDESYKIFMSENSAEIGPNTQVVVHRDNFVKCFGLRVWPR